MLRLTNLDSRYKFRLAIKLFIEKVLHYSAILWPVIATTNSLTATSRLRMVSETVVRKYQQLLRGEDRAEIVAGNQQREAQPGLLIYPYFLPENIPNNTSVWTLGA